MKTLLLLMIVFLTASSGDARVLPDFSPSFLYQEEESAPKARKAVQKHIFTVPYFRDYPDCAEGYEDDGWGNCVKIMHINQDDYEKFILDKLNEQFGKEYESDYDDTAEMSNEIPNDFRFQLETSQHTQGPMSPLMNFYDNGASSNLKNSYNYYNQDRSRYNPRTESVKEALLSSGRPSRIQNEKNEETSPNSTGSTSSSSSTKKMESVTTTTKRYEKLSEVTLGSKIILDRLSESQTMKTFKETISENAPIEKNETLDFFEKALGFFQRLPIFNR